MATSAGSDVKQETVDDTDFNIPKSKKPKPNFNFEGIIELSSSDSELDSDSSATEDDVPNTNRTATYKGKRKRSAPGIPAVLPVGFLDPLPAKPSPPSPLPLPWRQQQDERSSLAVPPAGERSIAETTVKQFWKAGDYDGASGGDWDASNGGGMDRVRVHPKFLHSNATSHKWVLGAFAELLDNSLDEVRNGATHVNIDMVINRKDETKMLLIEDDGGGMDPGKLRHCMSLGYSAKSKLEDAIGQYGNGFKTSTMRLGADVIVFSRCRGANGKRPSQSVGLLSYTFLRSTGKEDVVVPMLDYERSGQDWIRIGRSSAAEWNQNVDTIVQWSPFSSEVELLQQFNQMQEQGTRIFVYNLWEDDQGLLELDFDTDPHDIQIRGANREERNIDMAKKLPNSKHFLTYRHSLRSYAAILYLRVPQNFRIILRGQDVEQHNVVNDMMMSKEITYRPRDDMVPGVDGIPRDSNMIAVVTVGFVKDAKSHLDVQGFNVYHKNRLIKPFWRVWHPPGSDGRGVIGVLEANFIEPAHDKQGFERTTILTRLEARLIQMQRTYWTSNCHKIGYAPRGSTRRVYEKEMTPDSPSSPLRTKHTTSDKTHNVMDKDFGNGHLDGKGAAREVRKRPSSVEKSSLPMVDVSDDDVPNPTYGREANGSSSKPLHGKDKSPNIFSHEAVQNGSSSKRPVRTTRNSAPQDFGSGCNDFSPTSPSSLALAQLKEENLQLRERLKKKEESIIGDYINDLLKEKEKCKSLEAELKEANRLYEQQKAENEALLDLFADERDKCNIEAENLKKKLKEATTTIEQLLSKVQLQEKLAPNNSS